MPELSVEHCITQIAHTLGAGQKPSAVGNLRILNDAGEYLCSMKAWGWLQGKRVQLDFESGQDHVWLPEDFMEITGISTTEGLTLDFEPATVEELVKLRTRSLVESTSLGPYYYALTFGSRFERATGSALFSDVPGDDATIILDDGVNPPLEFSFDSGGTGLSTGDVLVDVSASGMTAALVAEAFQDAIQGQLELGALLMDSEVSDATVALTAREAGSQGNKTITSTGTTNATLSGMSGGTDGGAPRPRLEIWPDPTADDADAVTLYYRAGWETLDEDSQYVSIPVWLQTLYLQLVRAVARGYEREDVASMTARCGEIMAGPIAAAAMRRDDQMQPYYGEPMGGAADLAMGRHRTAWTYGPIQDPS